MKYWSVTQRFGMSQKRSLTEFQRRNQDQLIILQLNADTEKENEKQTIETKFLICKTSKFVEQRHYGRKKTCLNFRNCIINQNNSVLGSKAFCERGLQANIFYNRLDIGPWKSNIALTDCPQSSQLSIFFFKFEMIFMSIQ